jgi:glycosyltransferase involved in cell wall biosynthesis
MRILKILTVVSTYAPHEIGGAEVSAQNTLRWLRDQGHVVAALTTAQKGESELFGEMVDGIRVWRMRWPRCHTHLEHSKARSIQKFIWHAQDHFDPRNRGLVSRVLDEFKPDVALVRVISGIGYNAYYEFAKRDIPTVCFLHDLNLVCARSDMFRNGAHCARRCGSCKIVSRIRFAAVGSIPRVSFCSPSQANLDLAALHIPLHKFRSASILNANRYPPALAQQQSVDRLRFLYVGRLHSTKGVDVLLEAARLLADEHEFTLTVVGGGPQEAELRIRFGSQAWCRFAGQVSQEEVANFIASSDVLCIPSVWTENSPGVVIHALSKGVPVIGSDIGGIPEYVRHGENGLLVRPKDVDAWCAALASVLDNFSVLEAWRGCAKAQAGRFDQDAIGREIVAYMEQTIDGPRGPAP